MMKRQEYLSASREDMHAAHRAYYGQFVNQSTINTVVRFIGRERLLASTDPHFNDIPLAMWDRLNGLLPIAASMKDAGDYLTLGGIVCIAKEAARQYVEKVAEETKP